MTENRDQLRDAANYLVKELKRRKATNIEKIELTDVIESPWSIDVYSIPNQERVINLTIVYQSRS
ncbi:MAG: hypothetical protein AABX10_00090 [Nanoarchaeota archaeon]